MTELEKLTAIWAYLILIAWAIVLSVHVYNL